MRITLSSLSFTSILLLTATADAQPPQGLAWRDPAPTFTEAHTPYDKAATVLGRLKRPLVPLAFSADGKWLAFFQGGIPSREPCPLHLLEVSTGKIIHTLPG